MATRLYKLCLVTTLLQASLAVTPWSAAAQNLSPPAQALPQCTSHSSAQICLQTVALAHHGGNFSWYVASTNGMGAPHAALIVVHGYPHDARYSLQAGIAAIKAARITTPTRVIAPIFQAQKGAHCQKPGEVSAKPGDARWSCGGWMSGEVSLGNPPGISSFHAMDTLVRQLHQQWPDLHDITVAGFSAGGQFVQHYIGVAAPPPGRLNLRYLVASPGSWLYFDAQRPVAFLNNKPVADSQCSPAGSYPARCQITMALPDATACPDYNSGKYGVARWPLAKTRAARIRYQQADISYMVGAQDSGTGPGTASKRLDKTCAAMLQGSYRLQRAQNYLAWERARLPSLHPGTLSVIPGCAHDVACVLPGFAAKHPLF
ncbi:hypothetical protein [Mangrovibacter plantisponsor]|uniref:Alpha/beta hydrolase n=1 Tax=Mangrovibacter plantisponsor TaxID=451513 RepID=A0A317Q535_9ENTR|nr:hypothetical protein [Mangrovibacter plantisponsor]PWW10875.1 hypothetical protein DES37_103252 [Mangrovibacter plantisponsor]